MDPAPRQVRDLFRHAGAARVAFNWGLARIKANLSQRAAERSYGIAEADLIVVEDLNVAAMVKNRKLARAVSEYPAPGGPRPGKTGTFAQQWANH